jgi:hypothetical protein
VYAGDRRPILYPAALSINWHLPYVAAEDIFSSIPTSFLRVAASGDAELNDNVSDVGAHDGGILLPRSIGEVAQCRGRSLD